MWTQIASFFSICYIAANVGQAFQTDRGLHRNALGALSWKIERIRLYSSEDDIAEEANPEPIAVSIDTTLSDEKMRSLFAWIKCAFDRNPYDPNDVYAYYYQNIELAIASSFGDNLPKDSMPAKLMEMAVKSAGDATAEGWEDVLIGDVISRRDREQASLGAMGAAQWSGRFMTRPHCK